MNKSHTIFKFSLSVITLIISLGAFIFFFNVIKNKNEHTSATLSTLAEKVAKKQNSQAILKKVAEVDSIKDTINNYFVDSKEIDSFISYLENLGTSSNTDVKVESFDVSPASKDLLMVKISGTGTFSNTMNILKLLENSPYKIHITKVNFDQQSGSPLQEGVDVKQTTSSKWHLEVSFNVLISS